MKLEMLKILPKAELHLHLDGALNADLALQIIQEEKLWYEVFQFFHHVENRFSLRKESLSPSHPKVEAYAQLWEKIENYLKAHKNGKAKEAPFFHIKENALLLELLNKCLQVSTPCSCQAELLDYFQLPVLLLQSKNSLQKVCSSLLKQKRNDGVRYLELRFAPFLHCEKGLSFEEVLDAVCLPANTLANELGLTLRWILCGLKTHSLERNLALVRRAFPLKTSHRIVGIDLAGIEDHFAKRGGFKSHLPFFYEVKKYGFHLTFHGGETWEHLKDFASCIEKIRPERLAHGASLARLPASLKFLKKENICLDLCPTSNWHAGLWKKYKNFPLPHLVKAQVPCTINTDDLAVSNIQLSEEFWHLYQEGLTSSLEEAWEFTKTALMHAFIEKEEKDKLLAYFTQAWEPLLQKEAEERAKNPS